MSAYLGVRVVDFTQGVAGPMAAMFFADLGAEVVKVEPPQGDRLKDAPGYLAFNRGKSVLTFDLETAEGLAQARELIAGADVAIFDHAPGRLEALGLDAARLTAEHPALVHAWMPPYGVEGEWSGMPAHHSLLAALVGWGFRQAGEADAPVHMVGPLGFYGQALMGATAIGAALYERSQSGLGQAVVVSGLHGCAEAGATARIMKNPMNPRTTPRGIHPKYRLYRCSDGGFFFLGALFPNFYRKVFEAMGYAEEADLFLADDEGARNLMDAVFATKPRDEWVELLQAHGVPCAPASTREVWFNGETIREVGLRLTLPHPTLGEVTLPDVAFEMSATPPKIRGFAQPIGAAPKWPPRPAPAAKRARRQDGPLAGVKVLNLGTVIAGAFPGAILSYFGAEVVKVEPLSGDPFRYELGAFMGFNWGTRSLAIDLRQPDGRAAFLELVREADVVLDNYRPGVRERLGIDYATLKAVNPRIISCSISAYGFKGSRMGKPGFDPLMQAEAGFMQAQGGEGDPIFLTVAPTDVGAAGTACATIIAALNARERSGEGQEVRTSLAAQSLLFQLAELTTYDGRPPNDVGGWDCPGLRALHRYYACSDEWVGVVCETPAEATALGQALGVQVGDPQAALAAPREGELATRIAEATARLPQAQALAALRGAGVAAAPAVRMDPSFRDEWLWKNGYFQAWEHATEGTIVHAKGYADMAGTPCAFPRMPPALGEHTGEVLREYKVPADRIAALVRGKVVLDPKVREVAAT